MPYGVSCRCHPVDQPQPVASHPHQEALRHHLPDAVTGGRDTPRSHSAFVPASTISTDAAGIESIAPDTMDLGTGMIPSLQANSWAERASVTVSNSRYRWDCHESPIDSCCVLKAEAHHVLMLI